MKECDIKAVLERLRELLRQTDYGKITVEVRPDAKSTTIRVETTEKVPKA